MKNLVISATMLAVFGGAVPEAKAGSCDSVAATTSKLWKNWGSVVEAGGCVVAIVVSEGAIPFPTCVEDAGKYDKAVQDMIKTWNATATTAVARSARDCSTWMTSQSGRLRPPFGEREFSRPHRCAPAGIEITLKKTDGKAKTEVTVCTEDPAHNRKKAVDVRDRQRQRHGRQDRSTRPSAG